MIYKKHPLLSDYLLTETGEAMEIATGQLIEREPRKFNGEWQYKILTDETHALDSGKVIRITRRFTSAQLAKYFNDPRAKNETVREEQESPKTPVKQKSKSQAGKSKSHKSKSQEKGANGKTTLKVIAAGVLFTDGKQCAQELGISYQTVMRKAKAGIDGFSFDEEDNGYKSMAKERSNEQA